jgi:hypothetical protein
MKIGPQMWSGDESPYHGQHYQLDELSGEGVATLRSRS